MEKGCIVQHIMVQTNFRTKFMCHFPVLYILFPAGTILLVLVILTAARGYPLMLGGNVKIAMIWIKVTQSQGTIHESVYHCT